MKKIAKKMLIRGRTTSLNRVVDLIQKGDYKAVSFDIFDTLIKRNIRSAHDIFRILEDQFNQCFNKNLPILELREKAEATANVKSLDEEVTLEEIYAEFEQVSDSECNWLIEREIYLEKSFCQKNFRMCSIYDWCIKNGKKVFITSDMYLPLDTIKDILHDAGYYGYSNLYLSSNQKARKTTGTLFLEMLRNEGLKVSEIVHIGDALKGDYLIPKSIGISAILIQREEPDTEYFNKNILFSKKMEIANSYNIVNSFVRNNESLTYSPFEKIGFEIVGPILYGYCKWLIQKLESQHISKVFFLAREGFILEKAFTEFHPEGIFYHVIRVSRKATALPLLYKTKSLDDILNRITVTRSSFTIYDLLKSCELEQKTINKILAIIECKPDDKVHDLTDFQKEDLYCKAYPYIKEVSKQQEEYIQHYLEQYDFNGKVAVCDVGWHGTIQNALKDIYEDNDIYGYYIGKKEKRAKAKTKSEAFLFDNDFNQPILNEVMSAPDLFELFFLSTDGSAKKYSRNDMGKYYCILEQQEQSEKSSKDIIALQNAALNFVKEFKKLDDAVNVQMSPVVCEAAFSRLINHPSQNIIDKLKEFSFLNVESHSMVAQHKIGYYIMKPKSFIKEFLNNGCKSLFLRSVFKLPLPYIDIICFLKKFDKQQ
jgi:predicted HAD superfamily hydrolase